MYGWSYIISQYKWRIIAFIMGGAGMKVVFSHSSWEKITQLSYLYVSVGIHVRAHMSSPEKNFGESVFSFHLYMHFGDWTQIISAVNNFIFWVQLPNPANKLRKKNTFQARFLLKHKNPKLGPFNFNLFSGNHAEETVKHSKDTNMWPTEN